jgi:formylglycine-generating enzyme required for sulfatase activity
MAIGMTTAVGSYPTGASPYGAYDLAGNVWEWTSNLADNGADEANPDTKPLEIAMLRGGSWVSAPSDASGVARHSQVPYGYSPAIGFRLVCVSDGR